MRSFDHALASASGQELVTIGWHGKGFTAMRKALFQMHLPFLNKQCPFPPQCGVPEAKSQSTVQFLPYLRCIMEFLGNTEERCCIQPAQYPRDHRKHTRYIISRLLS